MIKKTILIVFVSIILLNGVLALTAESENYSTNIFGAGVQGNYFNSTNLTGRAILLTDSGTANAETDNFSINVGFWDNSDSGVSINSYSISPKSTSIGSIVGLYISASNFQNVWVKIVAPNSQEQIVSLINNQTLYYLPNPSILGKYEIIFYANSSSGAIVSMIDYFELTAQTSPSNPSSSGSGGSSGGRGGSTGGGSSTIIIEKNCSYDWDCTSWSLCSAGKQYRNCTNIGTCIGNSSRPTEETSCSNALFDIFFKLTDMGLVQNGVLIFYMEMIDKMNAEKIDVYIKYSITDSNNAEIFRQIETRAIQGNLTYKKEINDVNLSAGDYVLRVDVLYGNMQRAYTEYKFTVNDKGIITKVEEKPRWSVQALVEPIASNYILLDILVLLMLMTLIILISKQISTHTPSANKKDTQAYQENEQTKSERVKSKNKTETPPEPNTVPHENPQEVNIKSALLENLREEPIQDDSTSSISEARPEQVQAEKSRTTEIKLGSSNTDVSGRVLGVGTSQHPNMYLREIIELLDKCENALNNGMIEDAQDRYDDAREIYFGSGLDYEQKAVVYLKMMELHGKLSKF